MRGVAVRDRNVVGILLLLHERGRTKSKELSAVNSNYAYVRATAERLLDEGLVECYKGGASRNTVFWELTPRGESAARCLVKADEIISGRPLEDEGQKVL